MQGKVRTRKTAPRRRLPARPFWRNWSQERLMDVRICDLELHIEGSQMEERIAELYEGLERGGIRFRPHFWFSDEWFSPSGIPGIAVPFYMAHPRLMRLERSQMLDVEGGSRLWCMRILRHETGHAIDHAYQLHRRRRWQHLFGRSSLPYPVIYRPRPFSKRFVHHLDSWYAQSHPDEDFAETFAVWMSSRPGTWRKRYHGWPALKKLEYVDELMAEVGPLRPLVSNRRRVEGVSTLRDTLRQHYEDRRARYGINEPMLYDRELLALFSDEARHAHRESAVRFLRSIRADVLEPVARWTGQTTYTVDQLFREIVSRCRTLRLRRRGSREQATRGLLVLLTVQTMNDLQRGRLRLAL